MLLTRDSAAVGPAVRASGAGDVRRTTAGLTVCRGSTLRGSRVPVNNAGGSRIASIGSNPPATGNQAKPAHAQQGKGSHADATGKTHATTCFGDEGGGRSAGA